MSGGTIAPPRAGWKHANTRSGCVASTPHTHLPAELQSVARIDEQLFRPGSWRALNAANQVVAGVRPGTLDAAWALCGQGTVTAFFGRLRPGVLVVDIDLAESSEAVAAVVGWCVERELWHLVRASGRPGHQHVFVVAGEHGAELETLTARLRTALRVGRPAIDVRDTVRPLCAPHRSGGGHPPQPQRVRSAARSLPKALAALDHTPETERRGGGTRSSPPSGWGRPVVAAVPKPTRARALPQAWSTYLSAGTTPSQVAGWSDRSRSALEACVTYQMVACGWSVQRAWLAVESAHPDAMGKARERGRDWWVRHVWNRAVADHSAAPRTPAAGDPGVGKPQAADDDPQLAVRVRELQEAFLAVWTGYGRDRRHTLRFVLDTVAERMIRTGSVVVPCPERDLVIDTGIISRQVLRAALHQLHDDGWLVLATTFDPASSEPAHRSHHVGLPDRPPHPGHSPTAGGLALSYPPSSFTPLRSHLGPALWHTLTALPRGPLPFAQLAVSPGVGQASSRTLLSRLNRLATLGLALCDASGSWRAVAPTEQVLDAARASLAHRHADVGAERAHYELVRAGRGRWEQQREVAIQRGLTARWEGARAWWEGLAPEVREARQEGYRTRFGALPVVEQARVKDQLARRRAGAGVASEEAVRQAWIQSQDPGTYAQRVTERSAAFHGLPPPMRAVRVAAWEDHRRRWGIQRQAYLPLAQSKHLGAQTQFLERQETLALGDALDRDPLWRKAGVDVPPPSDRRTSAS